MPPPAPIWDLYNVNRNYYHYTTGSTEAPPSPETPTSVMDFFWTWQESLLSIPLGIIVLGTILGNFLVLYSAATRSLSLRLPTHYFIANLALADFLVGVLVMPFLATLQLTGRWYFGSVYCESWTVIHFWLCSASILSTCAVCIERYIGVRYPLKHRAIMSTRRIWAMIFCVWTLAGLLSFGSLYIWPQPKSTEPYGCAINQQIGHVIVAVVGILYVPAVIMIVLYLNIFVIARRHLKFVKKNSMSVISGRTTSTSDSDLVENKQEKKGKTGSIYFVKGFLANSKLSITERESSTTTVVSISSDSPRESMGSLEESPKKGSDLAEIVTGGEKKDSAVSGSSTTPPSTTTGSTTNWNNISLVKNVQSKKQINLAKRLSLLVGILLATYLPFFTLYMVMAFYPGSINARVFNAFGWIRYCNSCINPLIYAFTVPAYRKVMLEVVFNGLGKVRSLFGVR